MLAARPAIQLTPEEMARGIDTAAARQADHPSLMESHRRFDEASLDLRGARTTISVAGLDGGVLLWSILPGLLARAAPESWRWPEPIAARSR